MSVQIVLQVFPPSTCRANQHHLSFETLPICLPCRQRRWARNLLMRGCCLCVFLEALHTASKYPVLSQLSHTLSFTGHSFLMCPALPQHLHTVASIHLFIHQAAWLCPSKPHFKQVWSSIGQLWGRCNVLWQQCAWLPPPCWPPPRISPTA